MAKAEDVKLHTPRDFSKIEGKPVSGKPCIVSMGGQKVEGIIDRYFDDADGIEHAFVWVTGGPNKLHIVRPTTEIE